jgi:hypothetical protein
MAVSLLEIMRIFGAGNGFTDFWGGYWALRFLCAVSRFCVFWLQPGFHFFSATGFWCFFGGNWALLFFRGNWDFRASPQAETGPAHAQQSSSRRSAGKGLTAVSAFAV